MIMQNLLSISAFMVCLGAYGVINSRNMVRALMCLELMLNGVSLNMAALAAYCPQGSTTGQIFVIFLIGIAAGEAAVGLSIVLNLYRTRNSTRIDQFNILKW